MANSQPSNYSPILDYAPWIVLAVVLTGAAQFDTTAKLSSAFAYLILVAAVLFYGPEAIKNVNKLVGGSGTDTATKLTSTVVGAGGKPIQHPVNDTGGGV